MMTAGMISLNACSYTVDMVERTITKRASFSIKAIYNGDGTVTVQWNQTGVSNFAGYEIYMTTEPNNEYAGYTVIGAGYDISSFSLFKLDLNLQGDVGSFTSKDIKSTLGTGRFFFRVGIIAWDENPDERTAKNGYTGDTEEDYIHNTDIAEISGLAMVDIY